MNISIYETIKGRILYFDYEPGEMLNEKHMAEEFGVSRTPVREVLLRLEWENLLTIIPRAGIVVTKVDFQELREVFQTRVPLEGLIGRLCAAKTTDFHLSKLEEIKFACEDILESRNRRALLQVDIDFRNVLHDAIKNNSLKETSDFLYFQTTRLWHFIFDKTDFTLLVEDEIEYMNRSILTFKARDLDKAEKYRRQIVLADLNRVRNIFEFSQDEFLG